MGWFHRGSEPAQVVSVLGRRDHRAAGAAVLLSSGHVLTCAHVVNDAVGADHFSAARPEGDDLVVAFHGDAAPQRVKARVALWVPPRRHRAVWHGDLCVLELAEPAPPWARPAVWADMAEGQSLRAWHGGGERITVAGTTVLQLDGHIAVVDGSPGGAAIGPGYSGGPLWSGADASVVGIVTGHIVADPAVPLPQQVSRRSLALPWQRVRQELRAAYAPPEQRGAAEGARGVREGGAPLDPYGIRGPGGSYRPREADEPHPAHGPAGHHPAHGPLGPHAAHVAHVAHGADELAALLGLDGGGRPREHRPPLADDPVAYALTGALRCLLSDPALRADQARALAAQLGIGTPADGSAPSLDELARLLVTVERALPTLTESLAAAGPGGSRPDGLDDLIAAGRLVGRARLLSVAEYRTLLSWLGEAVREDPALVPRAAREALRYAELPAVLATAALDPLAVERAVAALEGYQDGGPVPVGTPGVPALVQLVELVAACARPDVRDSLRAWNAHVTARLGIHPAALTERRADAGRWAAHRPEAVTRLVAVVTAADAPAVGTERRYGCAVWRAGDDGALRRLPVGDESPRTPEEVGRMIREAAEGCAAPGDAPPAVEVVVGRDALQLPVDEWDTGSPNAFVPSLPLGVMFRTTLRCPEMSRMVPTRDEELLRRWNDGVGRPLVVGRDCADPRRLAGLLTRTHTDANQVVLHGPAPQKQRLLELCLALGVPVILWDREALSHDHADRLDPVAPTGPLHRLPHRVGEFRTAAMSEPDRHPARPSLVWEDSVLALPSVVGLADPPGAAAHAPDDPVHTPMKGTIPS
ncbi:trypsin-like peptidase domain-containing protein [Streptomyces sp. NPDC050504]|uniref:VMAP-C domain-containing protein n=1 Tax=Streptomyces sp. NPDC050504 TaxID=3365618 RepID=UPI00379C336A